MPAEVAELAREALPQAAPALAGELGFVILHRCGDDFYFLLISTWRNENELWETVWAKAGEHEPAFVPWPLAAGHHPTFCVWELGAVCHEQAAWTPLPALPAAGRRHGRLPRRQLRGPGLNGPVCTSERQLHRHDVVESAKLSFVVSRKPRRRYHS